jgi:CubicO group peptidase (beta-lactamase class C family)
MLGNIVKSALFFFVPILLFSVAACRAQSKATSQRIPETLAKIEKQITEGIKRHNFPSITIGIVLDGKTIYAKGFGYADRENKRLADENTVYQLGSVTKTFTGNILAQLIVERKISLDQPLDRFFPKTLKFPADKNGKAITVKDIATHSAEFPRYPANLERTDGEPILGFSRQQLYRGIELVKIENPAGDRYFYSNFGYGVLGTALENLTGKTLSELLNVRIFRPLRMKDSSLNLNDRIKANSAIPYRDDNPNQKTEPWNMGALSGAGNIFSSVNDMNLFMIEILKESELNKTQQTEYLKINETWSYGLGCFVIDSKTKNTTIIHHGGDIDGYASYLILYPEYRAGLVILTNSGMGRPFGEIAEGINEIAFNELFKSPR